jgi:hypothetical protein
MSHEILARALRDLREHISGVHDSEKLRQLVVEINHLLSLIEVQYSKLRNRPPRLN